MANWISWNMEGSVSKQKNSTFSHKIHFSILGAERKCEEMNWVSPTKVGEQVFARTVKNIGVNTWKSTF